MEATEAPTPEVQACETTMFQNPEELIPEIWPADHQLEIEVISIVTEIAAILAGQVSQQAAEMLRQANHQVAEGNRPLQLQIEIAPTEMLPLLRPEEELVEPMHQIVAIPVALNTATKNTKTVSETLRRRVILVLPMEIPEVAHKPGLLADLTIKDLPVPKVPANREEQPPRRVDNITSRHKPILVLPPIPEVQAPLTATLHLQDLIQPDLIPLQAAAIATHPAGVAVAEALVAV